MDSTAEAIITHYEVNGLDTKSIAEVCAVEEELVRLCLMGGSSLYKARVESGREVDVSRDEAREMMGVIKEIARGYHDARVNDRLKAAVYVNDEFHGRNDAKSKGMVVNVNNNILNLNRNLQRLRAARQIELGLAPKELAPA